MKIRMKILSGFLILVIMLAVAGIFTIFELTSISHSTRNLLDDNYKSIDAAKKMLEALERENSGLLHIISGESLKGQEMIQTADMTFQSALATAENNLTIPNEQHVVETIGREYTAYKFLWSNLTEDNLNLTWYFDKCHSAYQAAKKPINELIALNDATMYITASDLESRMKRIIMPGIVAVISALVFALVFNFFINHYFVNPLLSITTAVQKSLKNGNPAVLNIETNDELKDLAAAVTDLSRLVPKVK